MKAAIGTRLGSYKLVKALGAGASAYVYLGEHVYIKTKAAIKVLEFGSGVAREELEQFKNEARTIARLSHPNIVRILEFGIEGDLAYLVMEYAAHGSVRSKCPKGSVLPLLDIVSHVRQIAAALHHAHKHGFVHRDVKPDNVLLGSNDEVWLGDFGIARTVQTQSHKSDVVGTLRYTAPEQFNGKALPASDQYSLGVMVYEWLCGHVPFDGKTMPELFSLHMYVPPPSLKGRRADITEALEFVVFKALAKTPSERYESVQAFAAALEEAMEPTLPERGHVRVEPAPVIHPTPSEDNVFVVPALPSITSIMKNSQAGSLVNNPAVPVAPFEVEELQPLASPSEVMELLPPASAYLLHQDGAGS